MVIKQKTDLDRKFVDNIIRNQRNRLTTRGLDRIGSQ